MTQIPPPLHAPMPEPDPSRSARHSLSGNPDQRADGAVPLPPPGTAPTLVSTAAPVPMINVLMKNVPITDAVIPAGSPLPPAVPVAVLTIFENQAVFRVEASDLSEFPKGMLLRLRKGLREVTGGTRW